MYVINSQFCLFLSLINVVVVVGGGGVTGVSLRWQGEVQKTTLALHLTSRSNLATDTTYINAYTYTHTDIHTYIHIHIHTHTQRDSPVCL